MDNQSMDQISYCQNIIFELAHDFVIISKMPILSMIFYPIIMILQYILNYYFFAMNLSPSLTMAN